MSEEWLNQIHEASEELVNYLDLKDWIVIGFLTVVTSFAIAVQLLFGGFNFNPLWVLTVVSLFFVYMQLRNQQSGSFPEYAKIVPHFNDDDESEREKLGLKNFGGPAINLRVYVRVKTESGVFDTHPIHDYETVNIDNGEFVPILTKELDHEENHKSESLLDPDSELYKNSQSSTLELFYTFESVSGRSHPSNLKNPTKKPMEEIVELYDSKSNWKPKQVRLDEIENRVIRKQDKAMKSPKISIIEGQARK